MRRVALIKTTMENITKALGIQGLEVVRVFETPQDIPSHQISVLVVGPALDETYDIPEGAHPYRIYNLDPYRGGAK